MACILKSLEGAKAATVSLLWLVFTLVCCLPNRAPAAPGGGPADPLGAKYEALLQKGDAAQLARALIQASADPKADEELAAAGRQLGVAAPLAGSVLNALAADHSTRAALVRAELLTWLARGDERPSWQRKGRRQEPSVMGTDEVCRRAAALLTHDDPFVRGLAEWAMAIRLHADYECAEKRVHGQRIPIPWPATSGPDWFRPWQAVDAGDWVEMDFVRQAAVLGWHRTTAALVESATLLVQRAQPVVERVRALGAAERVKQIESLARQLRQADAALREQAETAPADLTGLRVRWLTLRRWVREVALRNPDLNFGDVLFAVRQATPGSGNITAGRWNVHTPGGDIYVKRGLDPDAPARPLINGRLGPGHVRGLDLWWEADRVVFAYVRQAGPPDGDAGSAAAALRPKSDLGGYFGAGVGAVEETSHLYEMNLDGTGLRSLTHAQYHTDQEPAYLPNGDILFVSDRSNFGSQCAGALEQDNMILNLYRCDPDGGNLRALSNNKDFDRHPHVMESGQVLFLHWEYQERHLWQTHTLWTCRPDGTMTDAIYKQHIDSGPMSLREARQIPGRSQVVAIACGHHNWDQGAIFIADYAQGINEPQGMRNLTPGVSGTEGGYGRVAPVPEGGVRDRGGHYMFPFPLSEKSFLAAYSYKRPEHSSGQNFGLYYLDVWGNKELIHRDRTMSVAWLMPLRKTPRPPIVPDLVGTGMVASHRASAGQNQRYATATVVNVHAAWPEAKAKRIKYLRISQKVPWPCVRDETKACGFNDLHWMPAAWDPVLGMWDWGHARVIGIVPVEPDGSAYFKVPADQTVYFHALDENFLELRRMRSNVTFPAGESRSCIGCHESKTVAPPPPRHQSIPLAVRRPPSTPEPPPWGDRVVPDYERHLQPIFDRHCVRCHGENEPKGGLEFSARKIDGYLQSYRTLFGLKASDPTPFTRGYWSIWHPDQPALSDAAHQAARTFLRNVVRDPGPQQLVSLADYMGDAEVTRPEQFGSAQSRLTLTLLRDSEHQKEVQLDRAEWLSLVTWIDLNAQYWGTFVEKDGHYVSRRASGSGGEVVPPRRVHVEFPDPWQRPPAGEWVWESEGVAGLKP